MLVFSFRSILQRNLLSLDTSYHDLCCILRDYFIVVKHFKLFAAVTTHVGE
jgi:hypothetical protein